MALARITSWITSKVTMKKIDKVMPIEITVQPRILDGGSDRIERVHGNISVFAVEDELRYARLWYPTENRISSSAVIVGDVQPFQDDEQTFMELSELPSPTAKSSLHSSVKNFCLRTWSHVTHVIRGTSQPKNYIHSYLNMMFLCFVSAVPICTHQPNNVIGTQPWSNWVRLQLQLLIFILFTSLSAFQSFCQAKYNVLWFLFQGGINNFVKFSFNVTSLVTSAYCSYLLCHEWEAIKSMTGIISSYDRNWASVTKKPAICAVLALITALLALLRSLLILDMSNFSVEDAMLESSYQMSEDLFLWSSHNLNISMQILDEEFGNELNLIEILLAVIKILRDFAYNLQDGMLWDLIICVVFTLFCWMKLFMGFVTEVVENVLDENSDEWRALQRKREQVWRMYRENRVLFESVNNVFDSLLIFFHASNVLRYAFFMENLIYPGNLNSLTYVHLLYNIVKSEITYIVASRIAHQNKEIRKWLRNWGSRTGRIDVGYTEIDMNAVLDELDEEPLGLGKGEFIIHQGFHFGLLGLVSSLFVMLASKKP